MSDQLNDAESADPRIEEALREYLERADLGEAVNREEFLARHADIADALRSFIIAEERLRKMAVTKVSDESAGVSTRSIAAQGQETIPPKATPDRAPAATGSELHGQFGRYQIIRALGKGAMGAVYLAEDSQLQRKVAIKTPHFEDDPTGELTARFYREARAAATLRHSNICPVYDVGEIEGKRYISMAYIEGRSLSELIHSEEPRSERQILILMHKLALALQEAHDHKIVHRDLKPANIMVDLQDEPIIMDFGLARRPRKEGDARLTHSGMILGTPAYMSPEQAERDPDLVGPASDQYSLGVILYEMLTRQLPFRGSLAHVLAQILTQEPRRPSELRAGIDPRIDALCLKMMAKKVADRFPSMRAVADEMAKILKKPARRSAAAGKSAAALAPPVAPDRFQEAGASQIVQPVPPVTETDPTSLGELARNCLRRRDYDEAIQFMERIPEERRSDALQTLLEKARERADEIAFLICEIDEADELEDGQAALRKAELLLRIKPDHRRAREIQKKYSGDSTAVGVRIARVSPSTRPGNKKGWVFRSVAASGLLVCTAIGGVYFFNARGMPGAAQEKPKIVSGAAGPPQKPTDAVGAGDRLPLLLAPFSETAAKSAQNDWANRLKTPAELINTIGMKFRLIPPGEFMMGSTREQVDTIASWGRNRRSLRSEQPQYRVRIGHPYYLGAYEVTRANFFRFVAETGHKTDAERDGKGGSQEFTEAKGKNIDWRNPGFPQGEDHAVVNVSLADAEAFCDWLTRKDGRIYRLPREAEWEYACRAGTTTIFYTGDDPHEAARVGNMMGAADGYEFSAPVGSFPPNPFGLSDMYGNAWEMCRDWVSPNYAHHSAEGDPPPSADHSLGVCRGGAADCPAMYCRSAGRDMASRSLRQGNIGFRVVCEINERLTTGR